MYETLVTLRQLLRLRRNAGLTRIELEALKLRKFRRLIAKLVVVSPYYRRIVAERGIDITTCVPADFPVVEKLDLLDGFNEMVTDRSVTLAGIRAFVAASDNTTDLYRGRYRVVHTSGSCNQTGYFLYNRTEWARGIAQNIRSLPLRRLFGKRNYAFLGVASGHTMSVTSVRCGFRNRAPNNKILALNNTAPISEIVALLNAQQPSSIGGYTNSLISLAEERRSGRLKVSPLWIEAFAEALSNADRAYLQDAFGCGVYNIYGCTELQVMGVCPPSANDMTLYDDELIYEFYDDHIVVTNLNNSLLPVIRYRLKDILVPLPPKAGSPYLVVDNLIDRKANTATFINEDGEKDYLCSYDATTTLPGVIRYQIRPVSEQSFELRLVLDNRAGVAVTIRDAEGWFRGLLNRRRMANVVIFVRVVDSIASDPVTHKFRIIDLSNSGLQKIAA